MADVDLWQLSSALKETVGTVLRCLATKGHESCLDRASDADAQARHVAACCWAHCVRLRFAHPTVDIVAELLVDNVAVVVAGGRPILRKGHFGWPPPDAVAAGRNSVDVEPGCNCRANCFATKNLAEALSMPKSVVGSAGGCVQAHYSGETATFRLGRGLKPGQSEMPVSAGERSLQVQVQLTRV